MAFCQFPRLIAMALLIGVVAGCARPEPPTDPRPQPGAEARRPVDATTDAPAPGTQGPDAFPSAQEGPVQTARVNASGCLEPTVSTAAPYGHLAQGWQVKWGTCAVNVPMEGFDVYFELATQVSPEAAKAALQIEGATPAQIYTAGSAIRLRFIAGRSGEVLSVRLAGPLGPDGSLVDLGFRLTRRPTPTITAEVKIGNGNWQSVASGVTLPAEPLSFRFLLTGKPDHDRIAANIAQAFSAYTVQPQLSWEAADRLLVTLPEAPPVVQVYVGDGVPGESGINTRPLYFFVYTGQPPQLTALDPANGREEVLGVAPLEVVGRAMSPDGRWVVVRALRSDNNGSDIWLLNTQAGTISRTTLTDPWMGHYFWPNGNLVVPAREQVQIMDLATGKSTVHPSGAEAWQSLSPDGRYLAGITQDTKREETQTFMAPSTLFIFDLQTQQERVFTDAVRVVHRSNPAPPYLPTAWSADSGTLYFEDSAPIPGVERAGNSRWLALDVRTGQIAPAEDHPPVVRSESGLLPAGPAGWTVIQQYVRFETILLRGPDGQTHEAGKGLALGWQPDGKLLLIRWPNAEHWRPWGA